MEKGFNDEELADIMSEIESLEQEFAHDVEKQETQAHVEPVAQEEVADTSEQHFEPAEEPVAQDESHEEQHEVFAEEPQEVEQAFEEEVHAEVEEVQEDKIEPIETPKASISPEEANVHAQLQQEPVDNEMSEVLDELSQMPVEDVTPSHNKQDDNIHHFKGGEKVDKKSNHTAMSFHVEGDMKLELSFHIGDQFIGVHITDEGLVVGLEGGAKFTIPVNPQPAQKKAA